MTSLCRVGAFAAAGMLVAACGGTVVAGGQDGSPEGTTGPGHEGGTFIDATDHPDTTTLEDVTTTTPDTGTVSVDAGGIPCGMTTCSPETQECCVSTTTGTGSCSPKGECDGGVAVTCSGPASCPSGDVCCATYSGMGLGGISVACTSMTCMGFTICQNDSDCTAPDTCQTSPDPIYKYCARPRGDGGFHVPDGGFPDGGLAGDGGILPP
jgi:hypothetical protein